MELITDNSALVDFCGRQAGAEFITVDTEFLRDKTYWPILCLIQIAGPNDDAVIDPLADGLDLAPVFELMAAPAPFKVFHAARQDFEIFHMLAGALPNPVFDTQILAMVCGFGDQVGYETLVNKLARQRIDKTMRFTDWQRRPLSAKQLDYAIADVTHLRIVYEKLRDELERSGRGPWVEEEMAALTDPALYQVEPRQSWRRIKVRSTRPKFLALVRELAAWRETEAQTRDVPRNRVLRDDAITEIAAHAPKTKADLANLRGLRGDLARGTVGDAIMEAVAAAQALSDKDCPQPLRTNSDRPRTGPATELLKVLLKMKCAEHDVAQKLIASSDDIEAIAADDQADVRALHGWRRDIFGADAIDLKHGRLAITADGPKLKLVPREV